MTRLLLTMLLLLSSTLVYAEWMVATGNDQTGITLYLDPDTLYRKGDLVKVWQLMDYKTPQNVGGDSYLSTKLQRQFDCVEPRTRILTITNFSANMGRGDVIHTGLNETRWEPVAPDSVNQVLWEVACKK